MKVEFQQPESPVVITVSQRQAKALAAIIGTMGIEELDKVIRTADKYPFKKALEEELDDDCCFIYNLYKKLCYLLN